MHTDTKKSSIQLFCKLYAVMEGMSVWLISIKRGRTVSIIENKKDGVERQVTVVHIHRCTLVWNEDQLCALRPTTEKTSGRGLSTGCIQSSFEHFRAILCDLAYNMTGLHKTRVLAHNNTCTHTQVQV